MIVTKITGVTTIKNNMKKADVKLGSQFAARIVRAGLFLMRESKKICPKNLGHLYGSAFSHPRGTGFNTHVTVGYTAAYAAYVHENLQAAHGKDYNVKHADKIARKIKGYRKKRPAEQAKFLERPARQHRQKVLKMLAGKTI